MTKVRANWQTKGIIIRKIKSGPYARFLFSMSPPQAESIHSPYASASKILTEVSQKPGKKSDAQTIRCVLYNAEYYGRYVSVQRTYI